MIKFVCRMSKSRSIVFYPLAAICYTTRWVCDRVFRITFGLTTLQVLSRILYFPVLALNMVRWRWRKRQWYNRIDNTVVLGALPFRSQAEELVHKENIRAVISLNEQFELRWFTPSKSEWQKLGVDHYHFSVIDTEAPSLAVIDEALQIIHKHQLRKESVYIHCKSGKGRSFTVVACYLIKEYKWDPQRAVEEIRRKRPQVKPNKSHWSMLNSYYQIKQ